MAALYVSLPGTAGADITTPSSSGLDVTGDIEVIALLALDVWKPTASNAIGGRYIAVGTGRSFTFEVLLTSGFFSSRISLNGSTVATASSTSAPTIADGAWLWCRMTRIVLTGNVNFYTAAYVDDTIPSSWTTLTLNRTTTAGAPFASGSELSVGGVNVTGLPAAGKFKRYILRNSGSAVADFNPVLDWVSGSSWVSSATGETWTLQGTAVVVPDVTGTLAATLGNATSNITGARGVSGTLGSTLGNATSSMSGTFTAGGVSGTLTATVGNATSTVTGTHTPPTVTGTLTATLTAATPNATGTFTPPLVTGTLSAILGAATGSLNGSRGNSAALAATLSAASATITATFTALSVGEAGTGTLNLVVATTQMQLAGATTTLTVDRARTAVTLTATNADTTLDHNAPILELV